MKKDGFVKVNIIKTSKELKLFYIFSLAVLFSFFLYIFYISKTVFLLVESKNLENQKRELATEISELELETLSLNDSISIDKALELGFIENKDTQFISQKPIVTLR